MFHTVCVSVRVQNGEARRERMDRGNSLPSILEQKVRAAPAPGQFIKMQSS